MGFAFLSFLRTGENHRSMHLFGIKTEKTFWLKLASKKQQTLHLMKIYVNDQRPLIPSHDDKLFFLTFPLGSHCMRLIMWVESDWKKVRSYLSDENLYLEKPDQNKTKRTKKHTPHLTHHTPQISPNARSSSNLMACDHADECDFTFFFKFIIKLSVLLL